jgi:hypothetical protein
MGLYWLGSCVAVASAKLRVILGDRCLRVTLTKAELFACWDTLVEEVETKAARDKGTNQLGLVLPIETHWSAKLGLVAQCHIFNHGEPSR